jgi:hypothetical protein
MKTDREMLELAAKAAGIKFHAYVDNEFFGRGINIGELDVPLWNPLDDDGDALRLVVKLGLSVEVDLCDDTTRVSETDCDLLAKHMHFDRDPEAATRRAIVRAAAHIGATKEA